MASKGQVYGNVTIKHMSFFFKFVLQLRLGFVPLNRLVVVIWYKSW